MDPDSEEDDDWTKYADTGYASSYDPWADMVPVTEIEEEEYDDEFDEFDENAQEAPWFLTSGHRNWRRESQAGIAEVQHL